MMATHAIKASQEFRMNKKIAHRHNEGLTLDSKYPTYFQQKKLFRIYVRPNEIARGLAIATTSDKTGAHKSVRQLVKCGIRLVSFVSFSTFSKIPTFFNDYTLHTWMSTV